MSTLPSPTPPTCRTLVDVLRYRGEHQPRNEAFLFPCDDPAKAQVMSNGDLAAWAGRIATHLRAHGGQSERVVLLFNSGLEYIAAFFGTLLAGAVAVPTYPLMRPNRRKFLRQLILDAKPRIVLGSAEICAQGREIFGQDPALAGIQWLAVEEIKDSDDGRVVKLGPDDPALLQYTSGSTGHPKGVVVSHGNLIAQTDSIYRWLERPPVEPGQTWLPLYHDMGLIGAILYPFYAGFAVGVMSPLSFIQRPARWLESITALRASVSGAANFAYDLCVEKISDHELERLDLSCWRWAFMGAEPIRAETIDRFVRRFEPCGFRRESLLPAYGCAESTIMVVGRSRSDREPVVRSFDAAALNEGLALPVAADAPAARQLVSSGTALADHLLEIVDPETREVFGEGRLGEIWVQGSGVAQGYFRNAEASARTFEAHTADGRGPFLRTGDLAFVVEGQVYITSRLKDLIIVAGKNHYPPDLEETAEAAHPALQPCGAAAFAVEGRSTEDVVIVAEVRRRLKIRRGVESDPQAKEGFRPWQVINADEIAAAVRQALVAEHDLRLHDLVLIRPNSLTKTTSGKLQRSGVREAYLQGQLRDAVA